MITIQLALPYFKPIDYNEFEKELKEVPEIKSNKEVGLWIAKSFFDRSKFERASICSYVNSLESFVGDLCRWNDEKKEYDLSNINDIKPETVEDPKVSIANYLSKFVLFLCTQTKAGLEIEMRFYPCNKNFKKDELVRKDITQDGNKLEVPSVFKPGSPVRLGFEDTVYYGLGYDYTGEYFTKGQFIEISKSKIENDLFINPFLNYEFRTFGGLDFNKFTESYKKFYSWYEHVWKGLKADSKKMLGNEQNPVGYYFEKDGLKLCINSNSVGKPTRDIMYKEQVTLSFHIAQLLPVIELLLDKFHVTSPTLKVIHGFIKEALFPAIPKTKALTTDLPHLDGRDVILLSGASYLHWLDLSLGYTIKEPMPDRIRNQANLLLLLACQWFKDVKKYPEELKDVVKSVGYNYMKGFSPILLRKPERSLINKTVVNLFLDKVTPFYDIYLPFKVCVFLEYMPIDKSDAIEEFEKFTERVLILKEYLNKWRARVETLGEKDPRKKEFLDSLKQGNEYVSQLMSIVQNVKALKSDEITRVHHIESCFYYSFSMYLVDLLHYDSDDSSLTIQKFYRIYEKEEIDIVDSFPMTKVDDREPSTVVAEFRSIPAKKNDFDTSEFREFAKLFYEKNI